MEHEKVNYTFDNAIKDFAENNGFDVQDALDSAIARFLRLSHEKKIELIKQHIFCKRQQDDIDWILENIERSLKNAPDQKIASELRQKLQSKNIVQITGPYNYLKRREEFIKNARRNAGKVGRSK